MKTLVTLKQNLLKSALFVLVSASAAITNAQTSGGLQSEKNMVAHANASIVKLASFTAELNNNRVDIKFATVTETNLSHVIVERSIDGLSFSDAALVFTYGNTTSKSDYAFPDNISKVKSTMIYYRLKIVSGDGSIQYSDIRIIKKETGTSVVIG